MKRRDLAVTILLDESAAFAVLARVARAAQRAAERLAEVATRTARCSAASVDVAPARHAFAPTLDLACAVCSLGPEECTGDTPRGTDPRYASV